MYHNHRTPYLESAIALSSRDMPGLFRVRPPTLPEPVGPATGSPFEYQKADTQWTLSRRNRTRLALNGQHYVLESLHVHEPAEHKINNVQHPFEVHFVFKSPAGNMIVVAVVAAVGGPTDEVFRGIRAGKPLKPHWIPSLRRTWNYVGSLTTPGEADTVVWFVSDRIGNISADDLAWFRSRARQDKPLQDRHGRPIVFIEDAGAA